MRELRHTLTPKWESKRLPAHPLSRWSLRPKTPTHGGDHGDALLRHKHDTSLWSRIIQTSEDTVLSIIDRTLFDLGWDVWALIFDGLIAAPSAACAEPDVNKALAAAQGQAACVRAGWKVVLALKPLNGLQDETPTTITKASAARENWACREAAAADELEA